MAPERGARAADSTTVAAGKSRFETFRALRNVNYRYLWMGQVAHAASLWMEQVVRPLLMLELTGSALQVGNIIVARMVPQLVFGLIAGAAADRYDKRRVLLGAQTITMSSQLFLGLLVISSNVETWHVYATAVASGSANAFTQPARSSIIPRLVPREDLLNAIALNTAAMNTMRIVGAGLGGLLLIPFDFGEVYILDAIIYLGVIYMTFRIRVPAIMPGASPEDASSPGSHGRRSRSSGSLFGDFLDGFRYLRTNRQILLLVGLALIPFMLGQPYQQIFVPLIALEELDVDRSVVGLMLASTGIGALLASMAVASRKSVRRRGNVMLASVAVFGAVLLVFAQSDALWLSICALFVAGGTTVVYMSLNTSLLLEYSPPEMHGRVMSFMSLDRGLVSVGAVLGGALSEWLSASTGLTIMASVMTAFVIATFVFVKPMRQMD